MGLSSPHGGSRRNPIRNRGPLQYRVDSAFASGKPAPLALLVVEKTCHKAHHCGILRLRLTPRNGIHLNGFPSPMNPNTTHRSASRPHERWFYTIASITLLAFTLIGFRMFYLQGNAFPGRPLPPPIRPLLITHGVLMTAWMVLSSIQPLLVAMHRKRVHMMLGRFGALLAAALVVVGLCVGIEATKVTPPDLQRFGLVTKQFLAVPVGSIVLFGGFVLAGVLNRRRPEIHRPMMLLASLSILSAALARIPVLNQWYVGTRLETFFTAFLVMVLLGMLLLAIKLFLTRKFDRWFAAGFTLLTASSVGISLGARTQVWDQISSFLLR